MRYSVTFRYMYGQIRVTDIYNHKHLLCLFCCCCCLESSLSPNLTGSLVAYAVLKFLDSQRWP